MIAVDTDNLEQIIDGCLTNNRKAQESLFRSFYGFAMNVALRYSRDDMDAADIVSHAFVKIFKSIHTFDQTKGSIQAWIKKIVVNEGIDHFKSRSKFKNDLELESVPEPQINNAILERMGVDEIMALVKRLPPATHAVFILYAVEGYNHREIAEKLSISEGTSKWHLSEARKSLQKQIQNIK
jgi:RNA polymerase sigma-70 factor (ECF subfamily)